MKVIQNFSSNKHIVTLPILDILIWAAGLLRLRKLGHTIKLYCKDSDIDFLKEWKLYDLYDEIDTNFLNNYISPINDTNFWSVRKLACIEHEFKINSEQFIYIDTDIILNIPLQIPGDLLVWSPEPDLGVYLDWDHYSLPSNYILPQWLLTTKDAYNCGVLGFKTYELFKQYLNEYYSFTINNKCKLSSVLEETFLPTEKRAIWACTAEQRILKALADYKNWDVAAININNHECISESGIHYYILRNNWRVLRDNKAMLTEDQQKFFKNQLNITLQFILSILPEEIRNYYITKNNYLQNFWELGTPIDTYF